uniref:Uncharacterized protein n=1 Tax=Vespula pensylvanica TaxID=30213 RepID=A0A834N4B1_VESPE|nr:hypothetical protein H0235_017054 [Vespula pensylvanica]
MRLADYRAERGRLRDARRTFPYRTPRDQSGHSALLRRLPKDKIQTLPLLGGHLRSASFHLRYISLIRILRLHNASNSAIFPTRRAFKSSIFIRRRGMIHYIFTTTKL